MKITIKNLRQNISLIADQVEFNKKEFIITRNNKPVGKIVPYVEKVIQKDIEKKIAKLDKITSQYTTKEIDEWEFRINESRKKIHKKNLDAWNSSS